MNGDGAAPPRSRYQSRKDQILAASGGLFNRHGLRDATLAVVAAEIGLNLKSLRYYFRRKEDLVAAAFLFSIDLHRALVDDALAIAPGDERLRGFLRGYFALLAQVRRGEVPEFVQFGDIRALTEPHLDLVGTAYVDLFRSARRLFDGTAAASPEQRNAHTHLLLSQLHWSAVWTADHKAEDFARVADRMADVLLHGIAARADVGHAGGGVVPTPFATGDRLSRESFLRAATDLINATGYRGASVDRISAVLNVTKGAFYHHNDTRDQLVVACFERSFAIIRDAQDRALASQADGLAHIADAVGSLVSRQIHPAGALLRTSALTAIGPDLRREMQRRLALSTARFADMLNDGLIDGSVRPCDIRIAAEIVTALVNSAQELPQWAPGTTADTATALYTRALLHGILAPADAGPG